jgi:DNA primase
MIFSDETYKAVKNLKIYDIVSTYVSLGKRGSEYIGKCPFHEDKSPSFTVNPESNLYYCFGCGVGGDGINFIQKYNKVNFVDAVLDLAKSNGIQIDFFDKQKQNEYDKSKKEKDVLYKILNVTKDFYFMNLKNNYDKVKDFLDSKNINNQSIESFGIGYAGEHRDELYQHLINKFSDYEKYFVSSGVLKESNSGCFDFFRNRIIIPIKDIQGKVVGFGGRSIQDDNSSPKYLNTPESLIFKKSDLLFGLDVAKNTVKNIKSISHIILTEGYFDVIASHQIGFTNTVACLGTAVSVTQLNQIFKYSNTLMLNLDSDLAGCEATKKIINKLDFEMKNSLIDLRIIEMPKKDVSDLLKVNGKNSYYVYKNYIEKSKNWIDWLSCDVLKDKDVSDNLVLKTVFNDLLKIVEKLDGIERIKYIQHFSEILGGGNIESQSNIYELFINKTSGGQVLDNHKIVDINSSKNKKIDFQSSKNIAEETILKIYINFIEYRKFIRMQLEVRNIYFCIKTNRDVWIKIVEIEGESLDGNYSNFSFCETLNDDLLMVDGLDFQFDLSDDEISNIKNYTIDILIAAFNNIEKNILEEKLKIYFNNIEKDADDDIFNLYISCYQQLKKINEELRIEY